MSGHGDDDVHRWIARLLDLPASERREWLERQLPDVPHLRDQLLAAVGADDDSTADHRHEMAFDVPDGQAPESMPTSFGRYTVLREIGGGGMGRVFLARDPKVDRDVAIKVLRRDFDSDELRKRFLREARAAGRLQHEHIVTIFDVGELHGRPFIVMEYVRGETLFDIIKVQKPYSLDQRLSMIEALCSGLACAHAASVVHRDVKPSNIIVSDDGVLKILDFGVAKPIDRVGAAPATPLTHEHVVIGTLGYIAPEHLTGRPADARSDMFAAAVVAYELLTCAKPFGRIPAAMSARAMAGDIAPMRTFDADIPDRIEQLVLKGLSVSPRDRFKDMSTMEQCFAEARVDLLSTVNQSHGAERRRSSVSRAVWIGTAAVVGVLMLTALLVWPKPRQSTAPSVKIESSGSRASTSSPPIASVSKTSSKPPKVTPRGNVPRAASSPPPSSDEASASSSGPTDVTPPPDRRDAADTTSAGRTPQPATAVTPASSPASDVPLISEEEDAAIRKTLKEFEAAFERHSTPDLRVIQTSLTQKDLALYEHSFLDSEEYLVRFVNVRVMPASSTGVTVACAVSREIVPKHGTTKRQFGRATFVLEKENGAWRIRSFQTPDWW